MEAIKSAGRLAASTFTDKFLEKPLYEVCSRQKAYEHRRYADSVWVSTKIESIDQRSAQSLGFRRLFNYITGENKYGQKIEMTAPVTSKIEPGAGPNCENTFTVSFYVGKELWKDVPEPTNPVVFVNKIPPMEVYCRTYGGFSNDEKCIEEAKNLANALEADGKQDFDQSCYYFAGYDSPFKLFNRTNEVWFIRNVNNSNGKI